MSSTTMRKFPTHINHHDTSRNSLIPAHVHLFKPISMEEQDATVVSLPSVSTTQINWVKSEANYTRAKYAAPWIIRICKGLWRELQPYKHEHISSAVHYTSGSQLINELIRLSGKSDRLLASGVWQLLLEESAIEPCDHQGKSISAADAKVEEFVDDSSRYYRCCCPPYHMTSLDEELQQLNQHPLSTCLVATGKHRIDALRKYASASVHTDSVENDENSVDRFRLLLDRVYGLASDAVFRRILLKPCNQRTQTELEFVFSELSTSPSLGQLSISVRKELSKCINYEVHREAGALIFRQGDPGDSWYIIHRGSVWVHVDGQGYVCRLSEGDDFGKLAIVTGSERAASIILAENNCHFLRVDKNDFTRILTDVEESRVRLREGESDVLILERCAGVLPANDKNKVIVDVESKDACKSILSSFNYFIVAGTVAKILHHTMEVHIKEHHISVALSGANAILFSFCPTLLDEMDTTIEEVLLTIPLFTNCPAVFSGLISYVRLGCFSTDPTDVDAMKKEQINVTHANRVIAFLYLWCRSYGISHFSSLPEIEEFLCQLRSTILCHECALPSQLEAIDRLINICSSVWTSRLARESDHTLPLAELLPAQLLLGERIRSLPKANPIRVFPGTKALFTRSRSSEQQPSRVPRYPLQLPAHFKPLIHMPYYFARFHIEPRAMPLTASHTITFTIYSNRSCRPVTLCLPVGCSVAEVKRELLTSIASDANLQKYHLVEQMSNGEHLQFDELEHCVPLGISPNSRLFLISEEEISSFTPLPMQLNDAAAVLIKQDSIQQIDELHLQQHQSISPVLQLEIPTAQQFHLLDELNVEALASLLTHAALQLAVCIGPRELIAYTVGTHKSAQITAHVKLLITHFSLIYAWTVTQVVTTSQLQKRVQTVKKLIKLADRLLAPPLCDQHTCFAVVLGLQSSPVARLSHTWQRVPVRWRQMFNNRLLPLVDPSRNHRAARQWLTASANYCLPFLALLLKDMRFAYDANSDVYKCESSSTPLVNFEKLRLLAQCLRVWNRAISGYELLHPHYRKSGVQDPRAEAQSEASSLIQMLKDAPVVDSSVFNSSLACIDDVRLLTQLSLCLEAKKE